jgi:hypothetical protein
MTDVDPTLELYKTAVQMADNVSNRRAGANTFFLTLNTSLAAVLGVVTSARNGTVPTFDAFGVVTTAVAGVVLAVAWVFLIRYYRRLNHAKFEVINSIESAFPVQPFTTEWAKLDRHRFWEATIVEQVVPFVFMAIYVAAGIRAIVQ